MPDLRRREEQVREDGLSIFRIANNRSREQKMSKTMKTMVIVSFLAFLSNGCSALPVKKESEVVINPAKLYEECMELTSRDVLFYSFKSSEPIDFDIHYHEEGNIVYPIIKKDSSAQEGRFYADKEQTYCLMWTNIQTNLVRLTYEFRMEKK